MFNYALNLLFCVCNRIKRSICLTVSVDTSKEANDSLLGADDALIVDDVGGREDITGPALDDEEISLQDLDLPEKIVESPQGNIFSESMNLFQFHNL